MKPDSKSDLYQQVVLEHNRNPRNFRKIENHTHFAEGYNPLCGDHLFIYLHVNDDKIIDDISFEGDGCAISRASTSMMTQTLKGKTLEQANQLFEEFRKLVTGDLNPEKDENKLCKLAIFSSIWHFPSRVKCAILGWHTMKGAIDKKESVSTE